jgi:CheY-like chemotaxis protein
VKVVVLEDRRAEREGLLRTLTCGRGEVDGFPDRKSAAAALQDEHADVAVVGWTPNVGPELMRLVKSTDRSGTTFCIAVLEPSPKPRDFADAIAAGANDIIVRPFSREELLVRVDARARLGTWASAIARPENAGFDAARLDAWQRLGLHVAEDLGQMVGHAVEARRGWPEGFSKALRAGSISMALPSERVELRVSVVADDRALRWLGENLLGDANATVEALDDVLRELANTAGGALKRMAVEESVVLTTGLPSNEAISEPDASTPATGCLSSWVVVLADGAVSIAVLGRICKTEPVRVVASKLSEGMVVLRDLRNAAGAVMLPAGTRLTSTLAERVVQSLGASFVVEIACAA